MKKISVLLLISMLISSMHLSIFAENQKAEEIILEEETYYFDIETSANPISFFSGENTFISDPTEPNWIDRLDLDDVEYARDFYDWLIENSDGDGTDDALIDASQATYDVVLSGEFSYTVEEDQTVNEAIMAAGNTAINSNQSVALVTEYLTAIISAFDRDYPEVFWLSNTIGISSKKQYTKINDTTASYTVTASFRIKNDNFDIRDENYQDADVIYSKIEQRDTLVEEIVAEVDTDASLYKQVRYLNEHLATNNEYNSSTDLSTIHHDCRECISALEGRNGTVGPVCEAYARAFKVLCDQLNIPCILVSGYAGEAHMWNYVQMEDDNWYAVDVTWNVEPDIEDWLLLGDDKFTNHTINNVVMVNGIDFGSGPILSENDYLDNMTRGDINGDGKINAIDLTYLAQYIDGSLELSDYQQLCADADKDGKINKDDITVLLNCITGNNI